MADRYGSPRALADDIDLWLADEPVGAWPEPAWARAVRRARRHKPIVATAAAILVTTSLALAIGARLVAIERDQATRERDEARRQGRAAPADPWTTLWCVERLMAAARLQRDANLASDALDSFRRSHDLGTELIARFARPARLRAAALYDDACAQAQCAGLLATLPPSAERSAERDRCTEGALVALRGAVAAGYKDIAQIRSDADLDPLRPRPEFRALVADLAFPSDPFGH